MKFEIWSRTHQYQSVADIQPEPLRALHRRWQRARQDAKPPFQRDFSASNLQECSANIALVHLRTNPNSARYLMVGSNLKRLLGKDPTNQTVETVYSKSVAKDVYQAFGKTVKEQDATFYQRTFVILGRPFGYFRLILPFRLNDDQVNRLLVGIYPTDERIRDASIWRTALDAFYKRKKEFEELNPRKIGQIWEETLNR